MKYKIIFKAIVGSRSYGTNIETSDTDYKGIYIQDSDEILSNRYKEQIQVGPDECYYELGRFIQLAQSGNPTVLELLFSPKDCILVTSPEYELLRANADMFLTKKCQMAFAGYAFDQIKKAKGLNKKNELGGR